MNTERDLYFCRKIAVAHKLQNRDRSDEWNKMTYGKCFESIHGHEMKIELWLKGQVDKEDGMVVNFTLLKELVDKYDHKSLNVSITLPTAENFVAVLLGESIEMLDTHDVDWVTLKIRVWETDNAYIEKEIKRNEE